MSETTQQATATCQQCGKEFTYAFVSLQHRHRVCDQCKYANLLAAQKRYQRSKHGKTVKKVSWGGDSLADYKRNHHTQLERERRATAKFLKEQGRDNGPRPGVGKVTGGNGTGLCGGQYEAISLSNLAKRSTKPDGVSAVRWRIELRRRARAGYYSQFGEAVK